MSKNTVSFLKARLIDGMTTEDLCAIIDMKFQEWAGTEMEMYLRPATLFNATKCEQYLGQLSRKRTPHLTKRTKGNMQALKDFLDGGTQ